MTTWHSAHFQHFSICICPPFEIINNLVMVKIGHLRILSTCSHLLDLFPVKYKVLQTMNSLTRGLETSMHIHLKVWQVKRPHFKMLRARSGCDRLGTKVGGSSLRIRVGICMLIHAHIQMCCDVTEHLSSRHCFSMATWLLGYSQYMYIVFCCTCSN